MTSLFALDVKLFSKRILIWRCERCSSCESLCIQSDTILNQAAFAKFAGRLVSDLRGNRGRMNRILGIPTRNFLEGNHEISERYKFGQFSMMTLSYGVCRLLVQDPQLCTRKKLLGVAWKKRVEEHAGWQTIDRRIFTSLDENICKVMPECSAYLLAMLPAERYYRQKGLQPCPFRWHPVTALLIRLLRLQSSSFAGTL